MLGYATRAVCAALQANGPACCLPQTMKADPEQPKGEHPIKWVAQPEEERRREALERSKRHMDLLQQTIDYVGNNT